MCNDRATKVQNESTGRGFRLWKEGMITAKSWTGLSRCDDTW